MKIKFLLILILLVSLISAPENTITSLENFNKECSGLFSSGTFNLEGLFSKDLNSACKSYLKENPVNDISLKEDGTVKVGSHAKDFKLPSETLSEDLKMEIGDQTYSFSKGLKFKDAEVSPFYGSRALRNGIIEGGESGGLIKFGGAEINLPKNTNLDLSTGEVTGSGGKEFNPLEVAKAFDEVKVGKGVEFLAGGESFKVTEGALIGGFDSEGNLKLETELKPILEGEIEKGTTLEYKGHSYNLRQGVEINSDVYNKVNPTVGFLENGIVATNTEVALEKNYLLKSEGSRAASYEYGVGKMDGQTADLVNFEATGTKEHAGIFYGEKAVWKIGEESNLIAGMQGEKDQMYKGVSRKEASNLQILGSKGEYLHIFSPTERKSSGGDILEIIPNRFVTGLKTTGKSIAAPIGVTLIVTEVATKTVITAPSVLVKKLIGIFKRKN